VEKRREGIIPRWKNHGRELFLGVKNNGREKFRIPMKRESNMRDFSTVKQPLFPLTAFHTPSFVRK